MYINNLYLKQLIADINFEFGDEKKWNNWSGKAIPQKYCVSISELKNQKSVQSCWLSPLVSVFMDVKRSRIKKKQ